MARLSWLQWSPSLQFTPHNCVTSISVASGRQLFVDSVNKREFNSNFVLLFSHVLGKVRRHSEKYLHANEINNTKCPLDNKRAYAHLILCA